MAFCTVCWFRYLAHCMEDNEVVSEVLRFVVVTWILVAKGTADK